MQTYLCHRKPFIVGLKIGLITRRKDAQTMLLQQDFPGKKRVCPNPIFYNGNSVSMVDIF
jgi:hypothetical protein